MRQRLEHDRIRTALREQWVVDPADFRRHLIAFEQRDAGSPFLHQNAYLNEN